MDRLRRFEKIEGSRERMESESDAPESEPVPHLPRFEEPAAAVEPPSPPAPRSQGERTSTLERLVAALPTLECPACGAENSKFSAVCRFCQHPLDGDDSLDHNGRRLEQWEQGRLEAEVALERTLARSVATKRAEADPLAPADSGLPTPPSDRVLVALAGGLLVLGPLFRSFSLTLVCVFLAVGLGAWRLLGGHGPRTR